MYHANKIFRVAVDMIMNGSHFPSGIKSIICTAVGDIAASDAIFATTKETLGDVSLFISTRWISLLRKERLTVSTIVKVLDEFIGA